MSELTPEKVDHILAEDEARHQAFMDKRLTFAEWVDLLHRCQDGHASCMYVAKKIEHELEVASRLPKDPPPGLLMSMAIRYDHALGCDGYYDHPVFGQGLTHKQHLEGTLITMRQLYEEVSGYGFYSPEQEEGYKKSMDERLK